MKTLLDDFIGFTPTIRMAAEHSGTINKTLDAVVRFENARAVVSYVVNSNRPIEFYSRSESLEAAIYDYNKLLPTTNKG